MHPGFIARLRPAGPWRIGPASGARNVAGNLYHSDTLYSAVTSAIAQIDSLDEWIAATATFTDEPAVRLSSLFPYQRDVLFVPPPRTLWPPPGTGKLRWQGACFVPSNVVVRLLSEQSVDEDRWVVDGATGCLLSPERALSGPFKTSVRSAAALDRITGQTAPHSTACIEFRADAGLWCTVAFSSDESAKRWSDPVKGALRLLADSGFGGERSRGWGRAETPLFTDGSLPALILDRGLPAEGEDAAWWLLSVFSPAAEDQVDWSRGNYQVASRGGRIESASGWGVSKRASRMVIEGSVLVSKTAPRGAAVDIAPEGFAHPVYRYGCPLAIPIPAKGAA